ncbi:hypothetical protein JNK13_10355 [bacterium]|nr:hypothetical protein [bacterium]
MKNTFKLNSVAILLLSLSTTTMLSGCALFKKRPIEPVIKEVEGPAVPGTVHEVWTEPMHDTVRVPAGLDPTGTYYRPSHNTVVEIRPGRTQKVEYPETDQVKE